MEAMVSRPLPDPEEPFTRPYFDAARRGELVIQRCNACGTWIFYPQAYCHSCNSNDIEWTQVSGKGRIYSFCVVRHALHPGYVKLLPLTVAAVELDDAPGIRIVSNIVNSSPDSVEIGMPVSVVFQDIDGVTLPMFERAPGY